MCGVGPTDTVQWLYRCDSVNEWAVHTKCEEQVRAPPRGIHDLQTGLICILQYASGDCAYQALISGGDMQGNYADYGCAFPAPANPGQTLFHSAILDQERTYVAND